MTALFAKRLTRRGEELPPFPERIKALRLVPRFLGMVWNTKPAYGVGILIARVLGAFGPVALLWIGKLIIDGVIANLGVADPDWRGLLGLVALELGLALAMEGLSRISNVLESLLGDLFANEMSVKLMEHAATLDLERFEDPEF